MIEVIDENNVHNYWQIKASGVEWRYVLEKLKDSVVPDKGDLHSLQASGLDSIPIYFLHRKYYTAETISKATGLAVDKLVNYQGVIHLKSKLTEDGLPLPAPTVNYWGTA